MVLDSQVTVETCEQCHDRPVANGHALCLVCSKVMVSQLEALLKNKARKYFEATLFGVTRDHILFLTDDEEFTAFIVMSPSKLIELRNHLNEVYGDGASHD